MSRRFKYTIKSHFEFVYYCSKCLGAASEMHLFKCFIKNLDVFNVAKFGIVSAVCLLAAFTCSFVPQLFIWYILNCSTNRIDL